MTSANMRDGCSWRWNLWTAKTPTSISRASGRCPFQTWGIIRQAAAGLACAAESGVTHRDITPANLLLIPPPQGFPLPPGVPMVKVADFGLALLHEDGSDRTRLTVDQSIVGSPQYMAPEQLTGSRVDQRADIYALGATAYHLLTGRTPFEGKPQPQIFALKPQSGPQPLSEVCPDLPADTVALVNDWLAIDPSRRIGDYATLLRRIDELDANVVSSASHSA